MPTDLPARLPPPPVKETLRVAVFDGEPRPSRYAAFAARLKDAHKALGDPSIPTHRRAELTKRVLAITALARHDVTVAAHRLEAFFSELSALVPGAAISPIDTPSGKNTATQG